MQKELLLSAYRAIDTSTPLTGDCGLLCGAACCKPDSDGQGGVCLLPGEETSAVRWGEVIFEPRMGAPMVLCSGACEREYRPFLCRIFPLCPVVGKNGRWTVRMDARARAVCPLVASGLSGLDPVFVRSCVRAVQLVAEDPDAEAFLRRWAAIEAEFRKPIF